jgi:pyruvate dehydrogenase E1 component
VAADIWSAPSFNELRRQGEEIRRWNLLHPEEAPKACYVRECLLGRPGPVIAATDYVKAYAEQIRSCVPNPYYTLGTDGFGRSDTRKQLRRFFEVDRYFIAVTALKGLADMGQIPASKVTEAIQKYGINPEKPNPSKV